MPRRCATVALVTQAMVALAVPAAADGHGLVGRTDLPIPQWMFAWAAGIVLVVSFVGLAALWPHPRLQQRRLRRVGRFARWLEPACSVVGVAMFAGIVYSGLAGTEVATANLAPTFIYVLFWVGLPVASVLLGDVFRPFNPWRAAGRTLAWVVRRAAGRRVALPLRYPRQLGRWPAAAGLVGFAWLELVYVNRDDPRTLALLALGYAVLQALGVALYGDEQWSDRADAFGTYFRVLSRLSPIEVKRRVLYLRPPLSGVPELELLPGTVALLCVIIGTTTFDGASNGGLWRQAAPTIQGWFTDLGLGLEPALELASTIGLAMAIGVVSGFYWLGIRGMRSVSARLSAPDLAGRFAHTLVPIAFAYVLAHYFSLLIYQGQAAGYLVSDPLGNGANLLGTAGWQVNYTVISASAIWYVQVGALLAGHVSGLVLAHDRALTVYRRSEQAVRSQYWMLVVMVGFTCLGLWLLSAVNT
jgi:uncharacterized membrane protein YhaH (DUF805 family)